MNVKSRINERLDELEAGLRTGRHLTGAEGQSEMAALLNSISKFFTALDDSERDFVNSARMVIEDHLPWT